jgi:hypothetical protein
MPYPHQIQQTTHFGRMESRFSEVTKAVTRTFQWCLQDLELPKSHPDLQISFREWLIRGKSVFHISEKPGSGKSTLMKFVALHDETERCLAQWAGARTLVVGKFFFWKPGNHLEKSLEGLIRSLLYGILRKSHTLIPSVFHQYWAPSRASLWKHVADLEISYQDIFSAFDSLITSSDAIKDTTSASTSSLVV